MVMVGVVIRNHYTKSNIVYFLRDGEMIITLDYNSWRNLHAIKRDADYWESMGLKESVTDINGTWGIYFEVINEKKFFLAVVEHGIGYIMIEK